MKFSVVTAVRNGAQTIADTISSVDAQTWPDVEHVFIDGVSTDDTVATIRRLSRRASVIHSERDTGIYDAFNKGLRRAGGDVISFLNADDFYCDETALQQVAAALQASGADAVLADMVYFREGERREIRRYYSSAAFSPRKLRFGIMPGHPGTFIRREALQTVGEFDTSYRIAGDFEWAVRAFVTKQLRFVPLDRVLVAMRLGGISTSGVRSNLLITREIVRACRANRLATSTALVACRLPFKLLELVRRPRHPVRLSPR